MYTEDEEACNRKKRRSWCRFEEGTPEARIRNSAGFDRYEVADITANYEDAKAYCEERGAFLPYYLDSNIFDHLDQEQWSGLLKVSATEIMDNFSRHWTIRDDDWDVNEASTIEGNGPCIKLGRNSDGDLKYQIANCSQKLPFLCRYENDCSKEVVKNRRRQLTIGQPMILQDLKCSRKVDTWEFGLELKCKHDNTHSAEDVFTVIDLDNPSTPVFKIHRPAKDYAYQITM